MATKDWKQTLKNRIRIAWLNKNNNRMLLVQDEEYYWSNHFYCSDHKGKWMVETKIFMKESPKRLKTGVSKSQALAFAKQYMRTH